MEKLVINGGNRLLGEVEISGAKNAAVAIIPACLLVHGKCRLENVPDIRDTRLYIKILEKLNAKVTYIDKNTVEIDCSSVISWEPDHDLTIKMRGSSYLMGALLGRFGRFSVDPPGGCNLGMRPIDQHIKGFRALGAQINDTYCPITGETTQLHGGNVYFDVITVGGTINLILAATLASGVTVIENAAKEPHIVDLANFLNSMGAKIRGAGTDTIKITGVPSLHGGTYAIIPDQIEAGTFMIAAAATDGDVTLKNVIPRHLEPISAKLIEMGVTVIESDDSVRVIKDKSITLKNISFISRPYPGYPTDMQPQLVALLSVTPGKSTAREDVWEDRFKYVNELKRLGAKIEVVGNKQAIIEGVSHLKACSVKATDLRAGAAMIIAGLMAHGTTEIHDIFHIDRGYENFENKFIKLGGDIKRVTVISDSDC